MSIAIFPLAGLSQIDYDNGGRRNPFVPLLGGQVSTIGEVHQRSGQVPVVLEGIIHDPTGESMVLIDNESYSIGDKYQQMTLSEIHKNFIVFSNDKEQTRVWLREDIADEMASQEVSMQAGVSVQS